MHITQTASADDLSTQNIGQIPSSEDKQKRLPAQTTRKHPLPEKAGDIAVLIIYHYDCEMVKKM